MRTGTHKRGHVNTETEMGVMQLQAKGHKECRQPPEARRGQEEPSEGLGTAL